MAADRAAELTEVPDPFESEGRRAEHDRTFAETGAHAPPPPAAGPAAVDRRRPLGAPPTKERSRQTGPQFRQERASRDEFVRKATVGRVRQALQAVDAATTRPC